MKLFTCIVLLLLKASPLLAQTPAPDPHAAQPERPTVATHAGTVAAGWLEIEAGTEVDRYSDRSRGGAGSMVSKFGIASRLQLNVSTPVLVPPGTSDAGVGDFAVGMKWRLVEDAPVIGDFAILPGVKLPTGSSKSGTGTGTTDFNLLLISSHTFGSIGMDLNLGYTRRSGDGGIAPRNASVWAASFGGPARGSLGWNAEISGLPGTGGPSGNPPVVAFLGGPTLHLRPWLVLDAGLIAPITGPQPRAMYAGVTYNIGRIWD